MKYYSGILAAVTAISIFAIVGCSREPTENVQIQPGNFVITEPSAIAGKQNKSKMCSLDTVNGKPRSNDTWTVKKGSPLIFNGWAFSMDLKHAVPEVYIQLNGPAQTYYAKTAIRSMRSDANQYHQIDPALSVGFELTAQSNEIEPGVYEINILQSSSKGAEVCDTSASLTVN